jgi:arachidonate 15-lipoxygenase
LNKNLREVVMNKINFPQQGQTLADAYQYNYTHIEPMAMVDKLPQAENFSEPWLILTGKQAIDLAINTLIANQGDRGQKGVEDDVREFLRQTLLQTLQEGGPSFKLKLVGVLMGLLSQLRTQDTSPLPSGDTVSRSTFSTPTEVDIEQEIETALKQLLQGLPASAIEVELDRHISLTEAEIEAAKGVKIALQQLLQDVPPTSAPAEGISQGLPPTQAEVEVERGIQASSLLSNQPFPTPESVNAVERSLLLQQVSSNKVEGEVAKGVETALQGLLRSAPSNKAEVAKFITSNLVKALGADFLKPFANNLLNGLKAKAPKGHTNSLEDYRKLFTYIKLPEIANTFQNDETFAYMRVAGPNPVMLERMIAVNRHFPVTEEQYQSVMGETDSLQTAMEEGRVYLTDYAILDGALNGTYGTQPQTQKYSYAPLAMFAVPAGNASDRLLRPIAIQCGQAPADYPMITPSSGTDAWLIAKTIVQIADANFHEAVSHFARTHLFIEPFVLATHRQLPPAHPLFKLLIPHFQGTLAINYAAHEFLVAPQGGVNGLLSSTIDNSRVLVVKGSQARGFNADMLPQRLKARGVNDQSTLPVYPYRDDGLSLWEAIGAWVKAYLSLYYSSNEEVKGDRSLQNWAAELVAFDGGRLQDFGDRGEGKIETLDYLIEAVTMVIFTASAQHAAVNFPQKGIMSFAPAMPTAGYDTAREIGTETTPNDWFNLLPPLEQAQSQLNLLTLLGSVYFTQLGTYEDGHFTDSRVVEPLTTFQKQLQDIEVEIDRRNLNRPVYEYLKPSKIPQSINI